MAQEFYYRLEKLLKKDPRFVDREGDLLKSNIIDAAYKADKKLVELLFSQREFKSKFFSKIKDVLVFNINDFVGYIQDKNFLADSYTKYRNKIGLNVDGKFLNERKEVALVWPFKDCVLEGGMTKEDEKRKEIFFNEILAQDEIDKLFNPKVLTNWKRYTQKGEEKVKELKRDKDEIIRENLIIKGNNLLALHSLKQQFRGRIKLIYIDPPYNTGGDANIFTYNNNFNHSTWLTFIKNRLEIANDLLRKDGFIAITIDHNELFYLGELADEVFGRENRIGIISIVVKPEGRQFSKFFSASNEFMLVYAKDINLASLENVIIDEKNKEKFDRNDEKGNYKLRQYINYNNPEISGRKINPEGWYPFYVSKDFKIVTLKKRNGFIEIWPIDNNIEKSWQTNRQTAQERIQNDDIICEKNKKGKPEIFFKARESQRYLTHWFDSKYNTTHYGTRLLEKITGENDFSYPKSLYSILDTLKIMSANDDIVLDFFAGSGTTGHAVLELNKEDGGDRKFILVEQLDEHIKVCKKRIQKVIKNQENFIYCELMKYNEQFIEKIQKAENIKELLKVWEEMKEKSFLNYNVDIKKFDEAINEFKKLSVNKQKHTLFEILNKNQLYVNLSEFDDKDFKINEGDKKLNKEFYQV